jgi:hypothetical protein
MTPSDSSARLCKVLSVVIAMPVDTSTVLRRLPEIWLGDEGGESNSKAGGREGRPQPMDSEIDAPLEA